MKFLSFFLATCLSMLSLHASDSCGWYVRGFGGVNYISVPSHEFVDLELKGGYALGGSLGYKFTRTFRLEADVTYRENDFDKFVVKTDDGNFDLPLSGKVSGTSFMSNIFFDIPISLILSPYFGGGLGVHYERGEGELVGINDPTIGNFKLRDQGMCYQGIAGLCLQHFWSADFRLEYRFLDDLIEDESAQNHTLALTCQYVF